MSIDENAVPKRRSSAANRRRSRRPETPSKATGQPVEVQSATVATAETEQAAPSKMRRLRRQPEPEVVEAEPVTESAELSPEQRAAQRRDERRKAKQQKPERASGVGRIVNTERMSGVRKFYNDTASEIRKVVWPDRETTTNLTIVVIAMSVIMGLLLGGIDFVLFRLFEAIN